MDSSEFNIFEDRAYVNPTLSSGEQENFITNFRDIQDQNNQQIASDTYNLGKALPSNLGGLGGGRSYFNARYQTPQVDSMVANLKTAAQAQELNDVMSNYQSQLKKRYSQAQRAYNKRKASSGGNGSNLIDMLNKLLGTNKETGANGSVTDINTTGSTGTLQGRAKTSPSDNPGERSTVYTEGRNTYMYDDATGAIAWTNDPSYMKYGDVYIPKYVYKNIVSQYSKIPIIGSSLAEQAIRDYINSNRR